MLAVIKFAACGYYYPFFQRAERSGYVIVVNPAPDPAYAGFTPEQTADADRRSTLPLFTNLP